MDRIESGLFPELQIGHAIQHCSQSVAHLLLAVDDLQEPQFVAGEVWFGIFLSLKLDKYRPRKCHHSVLVIGLNPSEGLFGLT